MMIPDLTNVKTDFFSTEQFDYLVSELKTMTMLDFGNECTPNDFRIISKMPMLKRIEFLECTIVGKADVDFSSSKVSAIKFHYMMDENIMRLVTKFPQLEELDISNCSLRNISILEPVLHQLKVLNVGQNCLDADSVELIFRQPLIEQLDMSSCQIQTVPKLPIYSRISDLNLSDNRFVDATNLASILVHPTLILLNICKCMITTLHNVNPVKCHLTKLYANECKFDKTSLAVLLGIESLQNLQLIVNCDYESVQAIHIGATHLQVLTFNGSSENSTEEALNFMAKYPFVKLNQYELRNKKIKIQKGRVFIDGLQMTYKCKWDAHEKQLEQSSDSEENNQLNENGNVVDEQEYKYYKCDLWVSRRINAQDDFSANRQAVKTGWNQIQALPQILKTKLLNKELIKKIEVMTQNQNIIMYALEQNSLNFNNE